MENKKKKKEEEEVVEVVKTEQVKSKESNGFAIAGFVCSIISVLSCQGTCIIGLVLSILGLNKAKELNGEGKGLSIAGIVMGAIGTVIMVVTLFIICVIFVVAIIEDETWDEDEYYDLEIADVYDTIGCNSTFCEMADDGSYLKIDTNPKDIADYESTVALKMIKENGLKLIGSDNSSTASLIPAHRIKIDENLINHQLNLNHFVLEYEARSEIPFNYYDEKFVSQVFPGA